MYFSLFNWNGGPKMKFLGFENYIKTFNDRIFWQSTKNTLLFTLLMTVGQVGLAFIFTLFFTMRWTRFVNFHRTVMFFPNVISAVIIGLMWQLIYNNDIGLLNTLLRLCGREEWIKVWLGDPNIAMYSLAVPVIWQYVGYYVVILCSAVGSIPKEILEIAELDGANGWKRSLYITIPMIWNTVKICIMICVSGSFKAFDHIMIMTGGGPGRATSVLTLYNYNVSFTSMKLGYGCAMAVVILVFSLILTVSTQALMGGKRFES
jgi:raffinose/stachyose/melibiose transport system permease protein